MCLETVSFCSSETTPDMHFGVFCDLGGCLGRLRDHFEPGTLKTSKTFFSDLPSGTWFWCILFFFSVRVHVFFWHVLWVAFWLTLRSESVGMRPSGWPDMQSVRACACLMKVDHFNKNMLWYTFGRQLYGFWSIMRVIWESFLGAWTRPCGVPFQVDFGAARDICFDSLRRCENHQKGERGEQHENHGPCVVTTQEVLLLARAPVGRKLDVNTKYETYKINMT